MAGSPARAALRGTAVLASAALACSPVWLLAHEPARRLVERVAAGGPTALTRIPLEEVLTGACSLALLACAGWLLVVTAVLVGHAVGATRWAPPRLSPRLLRRLVLAGCGVALTSSLAVPAFAEPSQVGDATTATGPQAPLAGLALPDRAVGAAPAHRPHRTHDAVVVARGDSLWTIARTALRGDPGDAAVAAATTAVYLANRARIGDDPDLIFPGTRLQLPSLQPDGKETR